jgi:hypothetical protein
MAPSAPLGAAAAASTAGLGSRPADGSDPSNGTAIGDEAGAPVDTDGVAAQFALAALNDRYDTAPAVRVSALAVWADPDVAGSAPAMDAAARAADTVRSATITGLTVTATGPDSWSAIVDTVVTETVHDGPATDTPTRLQLELAAGADGRPRVVAAVAATP